nr:DNA-directed RNA polymerase, subunit 2 [Tanacetum cinerariifolium]
GVWNNKRSNVWGSSILSNQYSADVDRFAEKLKQGSEELALKMEYVPASVSKLENGNRRISFSAEEIMSVVGKPLLMDKMTRERCLKKAGKMDFARV